MKYQGGLYVIIQLRTFARIWRLYLLNSNQYQHNNYNSQSNFTSDEMHYNFRQAASLHSDILDKIQEIYNHAFKRLSETR